MAGKKVQSGAAEAKALLVAVERLQDRVHSLYIVVRQMRNILMDVSPIDDDGEPRSEWVKFLAASLAPPRTRRRKP